MIRVEAKQVARQDRVHADGFTRASCAGDQEMRHGCQIGGGWDSGYILAKREFERGFVVLIGEAGYKLEHGHHAGF